MSTAFGFLKKVRAEFFEGFHLAVVKKDGADVVSLQIEGRNVVGNLIVKDSGGIEKGVVREGDSTMLLEEEALVVGGDRYGRLQGIERNPSLGIVVAREAVARGRLLELDDILLHKGGVFDGFLQLGNGRRLDGSDDIHSLDNTAFKRKIRLVLTIVVLYLEVGDDSVENLVKDLAYVFRTRIELRQIGVRDEAKMLGGLGICGRPFCCNTFLGEFQPVSIKMAKEQGMSLNPVKISGTCGRLMCCLKYEQDVYSKLLKTTPKIGAIVDTPDGKGNVIDVNLITGVLTVSLNKAPDAAPHTYKVSEVKIIRDAQIKLERSEIEKLKKLEKD